MAVLDLHYVNELIEVRQEQHGGGRGAPPLQGGHRIGASLNRSCVVMLSALLQSYVEQVFKEAAQRTYPDLRGNVDAFDRYWKQMKNWGNPSDVNIVNLFLKLGVPDIFDGLSWQRANTQYIKSRLSALNQIRNKIAHGAHELAVNNVRYDLTLKKAAGFRNFAGVFGARFSEHVEDQLPLR